MPAKFVVVIILILVALDVLVVALLNSGKKETYKRLLGLILSAVVLISLNFGSFCLYNTYDTFSKISEEKVQTEKFHVIVIKNGSYDKVNDIRNRLVYVSENETKTYKEAKGKLVTKVDVEYQIETDYLALGHKLVDENGGKHDEIIFVSNSNYRTISEDIDKFKKKTKILYTISVELKSNNDAKRIDVTEDPFNIYITGIDVWGEIDQVSRSDVNMIMTVNPKTKEILLTSIPRDAYVELHTFQAHDKLTHSGIYGVDETIMTVEDWIDIDMNYYVRINFSMLVNLVDAIGGIDVKSDFDFKSAVSEYTYIKGMNHLDGRAALYFARERKAFEEEDAQRIKNQQIVLKAMIKKVTGSKALLTQYTQILDAVETQMQTNLSDKDISALVKMQLKDLGKWKIRTISIVGNGAYKSTYSMGMRELYVSIPDEASVEAARKTINSVMYPIEDNKKSKDKKEN
ncbi:MAG: LCP family protein [Clostridiales bacterium]|nr:LCP family protein [Clostridiales bacterium]